MEIAIRYKELTEVERYQVYALKNAGFLESEIAPQLDGTVSTIGRVSLQ